MIVSWNWLKEYVELDMSVEEAAKLVISAGLVSPDYDKTLPQKTAGAQKTDAPALEPAD